MSNSNEYQPIETIKVQDLPEDAKIMNSKDALSPSKNPAKTAKRNFPDNHSLISALESAKVGLWEWNMLTNQISWSENVSHLFGLSPESFESTFEQYLKLVHPEDVNQVQEGIQNAISSGKAYAVEHRIMFPDGSIQWLEGEGKVSFNNGIPERMTGIVRNITDRKRAELMVLEREKLFSLLTETTQALFLNPDWSGSLSRAFQKIGRVTEVDRMYLFKIDDYQAGKEPTISQIIEWNSGTAEPQLKNPVLQNMLLSDFEPFFTPLLRGNPLNEIVKNIPHDNMRAILQDQDIKSILMFPVHVNTNFWGFLGFDQCTSERVWNEIELSVLQSFSATLAGSIQKYEAESEKDEWKTKHELVVKASGQIIYDYVIKSGSIAWSGSISEELGYSIKEMGDINTWVALIHPEDRNQCLTELEDAEKSLANYDVYYRFRHKDGHFINIHDRGFFLADATGKSYRMLGMMIDVTENIVRETEKKEIEQAYKTLFDNTPDAIVIATTEEPSRILSANIAAAKMHGYKLEEFNKLHVHDIKSPVFAAALHERLENLLKGNRESLESEHKRKDGSFFPVMIVSSVIEVGGQKYVMSFYQDVSEAKITQSQLQESLSLLTATIESTADGILVVDTAGKVSAINRKFLKLWNIPPVLAQEQDDSKLINHVLDQLIDPDAFMAKVKHLYAHPTENSEDLIHFKDGKVFHRYSKAQQIGEEVVGRVWSFRNITDQVRYEKTLEESEDRFKRLQEASFGGICIHDNGIILDSNQGLSNITGYSREELIGMNGLLKLVAAEYMEIVLSHIESGYDQPYDIEGIRKDGTRCFLEVQGKNIPYMGRTVRVTEFRDITSRKKVEQQILQEKTRLSSIAQNLTRKNDQLEEFTQIVSHNLRSPVGNISTLLNLHDHTASEEDKNEIVDLLQQTSTSLLTTMQELNEVLKIKQNDNIEKNELNFSEVFERVLTMFHAKITETEAVVTADFSDVPTIHYANIYLESIFLNLLSNALKYRSVAVAPMIHFKTSIENESVILKVSDNGVGINLEKYGHQVFKMKKTFHKHPDSRGIGLFMIKNQIESMGGEISISSRVNEGTTFTINFNKSQ